MVKNDVCIRGAGKQNALFSKDMTQNAPIPAMSRIYPALNTKCKTI